MEDWSDEEDDISLFDLAKTLKQSNDKDEEDIPLDQIAARLDTNNNTHELHLDASTDHGYHLHNKTGEVDIRKDSASANREENNSTQNILGVTSEDFPSNQNEDICTCLEIEYNNNNNNNMSSTMEIDGTFDLQDTVICENLSFEYTQSSVQNIDDIDTLYPLFSNEIAPILNLSGCDDNGNEVWSIIQSVEGEQQDPYDTCTEPATLRANDETSNTDTSISTGSEDTDTSQTDCGTDDDSFIAKRQSRRKRKNPEQWKQSIRKRRRNNGEDYETSKGKKIQRRCMKRANCKCKFKCKDKISEEDQRWIFNNYWMKTYDDQREYIRENVIKTEKRRKTTKEQSRRKNTYEYFLTRKDETDKHKVCKRFFLGTHNVGERTVLYTLKRQEEKGRIRDKRGRRKDQGTRKISEEDREYIRKHIHSFPAVESHYCRKSSQRKYLEKSLSIRKMYDLYKEKCSADHIVPQKYWLYDHIFASEFNLGFHKPKKDICTFCDSYSKLSESEKKEQIEEHKEHLKRKEEAREQKNRDKQIAIENDEVKVLNFDLQKVLITPKLFVTDAYYSRKLATYNLTIYDMKSKGVVCNVWWETEAKRGSCEIATCLYVYNKDAGAKDEIIYYSDSCTGQQRNLPFCIMCLYSVTNLPVKIITHNYFEREHSQMEGDSVHATIECATKRSEIYSPSDWVYAIKNAKQKDPKYEVKEMTNNMVLDFKECANHVVTNRRKDDDGDIIKWNKIHSFQYRKDSPNRIYFKYEFSEMYKSMTIVRGRKKVVGLKDYKLKRLYSARIPICEAKFSDLQSLCKKGLVPSSHHAFYNSLPHEGAEESLPEPNTSDESDIDV